MLKYEEMNDSQSNAIRYLRPPIIERVATVMAEMTPESFEERLDEWRNLVLPEFPEETPLVEWRLNMQNNDDGVPSFDTMNPELHITHRFSRKKQQDGYDWSLRCPIGKLVLNMHSRPGDGRAFDNMRPELAK